jgi:hypothetical protein
MSITTILRATKEQDEWRTPPYAVTPLLPYLAPKSVILCPFDLPDSAYVTVLRKAGHRVAATHLATGKDFFTYMPGRVVYDYIISNPPYSRKDEVLIRLTELDVPFAMLMGATAGLFEGKRFDLFERGDVEVLWLKPRIAFINRYGVAMKFPPFQSCYVCRRVLPEKIMFARLRREGV